MEHKNDDLTEQIKRISGAKFNQCMRCGKCSGSCPAYAEMEFHPHQFVTMVESGRTEELVESKAHLKCLSCFACSERCPRSVNPASIVEAARLLNIRRYGQNKLKVSDMAALLTDDMPQQLITSAFRKYDK